MKSATFRVGSPRASRCVPQRVRGDGVDASEFAGGVERRLDAQHLSAAIADDVGVRLSLGRVQPFPAA